MRLRSLAIPLLFCCAACQGQDPQDDVPVFGTTVVLPSGLKGDVFNLKTNTSKLPNFAKMKAVGTVYTNALNIPPRQFTAGFPGVTDRFEWFGIDYTGRFWIEKPGLYSFELTSDDGSKLFIDDREAIDNDGAHVPATRWGDATLAGGIHSIRVEYFQGRRFRLALILKVKGPGETAWRVFSTEDFKPPAHPEDWKFGDQKDLDKPAVKKK
jgi:hypothetical protein